MQHTPAPVRTRICPDCDGHPTVAITTGQRNRHGARATTLATCPACHGTGTTTPRARGRLAPAGR